MSILDASVVLKWFVDEEDSDQALRLREEFFRGEREIVVPDLLLFEVANALRYNPGFTAEEIKTVPGLSSRYLGAGINGKGLFSGDDARVKCRNARPDPYVELEVQDDEDVTCRF